MCKLIRIISSLIILLFIAACKNKKLPPKDLLRSNIIEQIHDIDGDIALAFLDLSNHNEITLINADESFHAASTMKVPVMIELYKQAAQQKINLNDSILLKNEFKSIVDNSSYSMDISDDSDDIIYNSIGNKVKIYDLLYSMITVSSNLATNVLIELVNAKTVTANMRELGAENIDVLRGVEDIKAYELGLSNSTTAKDLMIIMKAIATYKAGSKEDCEQMLTILKAQKFNDIIPLYLPKDVNVAHKTGSITGVHHDAGIIYLPNGRSYVLVLLSKNLKDFDKGTEQLAKISKIIYNYVMEKVE